VVVVDLGGGVEAQFGNRISSNVILNNQPDISVGWFWDRQCVHAQPLPDERAERPLLIADYFSRRSPPAGVVSVIAAEPSTTSPA
jgi:hypothetical protein